MKKPNPQTQAGKVLAHLRSHGKINSGYAIAQLGVTRLAAKIFDLKAMGYAIDTIRPKKQGFANYVLREDTESVSV
ncbi:hypothetical protein THIOSC13_1200010 [uncultured Thiomicrorhabdus sp.]